MSTLKFFTSLHFKIKKSLMESFIQKYCKVAAKKMNINRLSSRNKEQYLFECFLLFHDGDRYHIETRPLIYGANRNQAIDLRSKSMNGFLYDNGSRHERVNGMFEMVLVLLNYHCVKCQNFT